MKKPQLYVYLPHTHVFLSTCIPVSSLVRTCLLSHIFLYLYKVITRIGRVRKNAPIRAIQLYTGVRTKSLESVYLSADTNAITPPRLDAFPECKFARERGDRMVASQTCRGTHRLQVDDSTRDGSFLPEACSVWSTSGQPFAEAQ